MLIKPAFDQNLLSMLETAVLLISLLEPVILFGGSLINKKFKRSVFIQNRDVF